MTEQEKIDRILELARLEGGELAGEIIFEFMRAVHSGQVRWFSSEWFQDLNVGLDQFDWDKTPQGFTYWSETNSKHRKLGG